MINLTKNILPKNIRLLLYNSLFKSHMQYGLLTWGNVPKKHLQKISGIQKKCVRNVANKPFKSHTDPIFSELKILKFDDLLHFESLLFMHKYSYTRLPNCLLNLFTPLKNNQRNGNYLLKKYKGKYMDRFPSIFLPKIWNHYSKDIRNILSQGSVKNKIKSDLISGYNRYEKCDYELCPDCTK